MVGLDSLAYIGNHGLERLAPGAREAEIDPALDRSPTRVREFASRASTTAELEELGVGLEDKDAIWSFHWRGRADERPRRGALEQVARGRAAQGLVPHWGRKVLEIRPPVAVDKGTAVAALLDGARSPARSTRGDDATDLDAFRKLRALGRGTSRPSASGSLGRGPGRDRRARPTWWWTGPRGSRELLEIAGRRRASEIHGLPQGDRAAGRGRGDRPGGRDDRRRGRAGRHDATIIFALAWWVLAALIGAWLGRRPETTESDRQAARGRAVHAHASGDPARRPCCSTGSGCWRSRPCWRPASRGSSRSSPRWSPAGRS